MHEALYHAKYQTIGMMEDEFGEEIMTDFVLLRAKKANEYRKLDKKLEHKRCKGSRIGLVAENLLLICFYQLVER